MSKVSYVHLLPEEAEVFYRSCTAQSRFEYPRIAMKNTLITKKRIRGLTKRSLLPQVAEAWQLLSDVQKANWKTCAAKSNMRNGYRLYVQDKIIRIKNSMAGNAVPSLLHQSWIGALDVQSPATEIKIAQYHPRYYWKSKKVRGRRKMRIPVLITEDFSLPLKISLNYSADLIDQGSGFAKFYARVWHSYQGRDIMTNHVIDLDLSCPWKNAEAELTNVLGYVVGYTLYFHLYNVRGTLYIDNVKAEHSGQNWVRDWRCRDIDQGFTRAFFQVPKHWVAITLPSGSEFDSIYKDF